MSKKTAAVFQGIVKVDGKPDDTAGATVPDELNWILTPADIRGAAPSS